jgi:hypothetical protein
VAAAVNYGSSVCLQLAVEVQGQSAARMVGVLCNHVH